MENFEQFFFIEKNMALAKIRKPRLGRNTIKGKAKGRIKRKLKHKIVRGNNRKRLSQVSASDRATGFREVSPHYSGSSEKAVQVAKDASRGIWKMSKRQVLDIAQKYKFNVPDQRHKTKHLGSTGIQLWRKAPNEYFLIKTGVEGRQH